MENSNNPFHIEQIAKRNRAGKRFEYIAASALSVAIVFLIVFLYDMIGTGMGALQQTYVKVPVKITAETAEYSHLAVDRKKYGKIVSRAWLRDLPNLLKQHPDWMNTHEERWTLASADVDQYYKGQYSTIATSSSKAKIKETVDQMIAEDKIQTTFNSIFFAKGDSKIPEYSGFLAAIVGSIMTMVVTMIIAFPIGVMTAMYLEEFAPDNKFTQMIEVNINNLAAIPSILFGLLGLAIIINFFGVPRSSPIAGGITLALMSLPVIIVSSKAALKAIPASIRQAGFGLGLTRWQIVRDHVLPLALPGMLTGSIIALAQAMGETAPLIMIGMIAFIPDASFSFIQASTVMPAQIFTWAGMPERAYVERTALGIIVLLCILLTLNAFAIWLRKKYSRTW